MGAVTPLSSTLLRRTAGALATTLALALGAGASPAGAVLIPNPQTSPGAVPQWAVMPMMTGNQSAPAGAQAQMSSHGGPVLGATNVTVIYWDPTSPPGDWPINYPPTTKQLTAKFLNDLATDSHMLDSPFSVNGQYISGGNAAGNTAGTPGGYEMNFAGMYTDQIDPYPAMGQPNDCHDQDTTYPTDVCLTDAQIQAALQSYITAYALPVGPTNIYLMMTPPDVTTCLDSTSTQCSDPINRTNIVGNQDVSGGYCGYHSVIGSGSTEILYGQIPWLYPKILNANNQDANTWQGSLPDSSQPNTLQTVINYVKNCQPDGAWSSDQTTTTSTATTTTSAAPVPAVTAPNGNPPEPQDTNLAMIQVDYGDVLLNVVSHVLNGIITDPNLNGWYDSGGLEAPDKCEAEGSPPGANPDAFEIPLNFVFSQLPLTNLVAPGNLYPGVQYGYDITLNTDDPYYVQGEFNATHAQPPFTYGNCAVHVQLFPAFSPPVKAAPAQLIGFDPSETISTLGVTQYQWSFNDGSPLATIICPTRTPAFCNPSVFHAFTTPGKYNVVLTVTDAGGNTATDTQTVTIPGTVPVSGGPPPASGGSTPGNSPASPPGTPAAITPPKATQSVVATTVSKALSGGLLVRYSVTQKVAGHFQVLLDAKTAKKLKLTTPVVKGVKVNGLSNPVQVGTALLETTKAGNSSIRVSFTKSDVSKLRKSKSLPLTVRLVAHNLAGQEVTVMTAVKLH